MLGADYILEGGGQRANGKIKIQFHLIETKTDKYLWSKPFVREITEDDFLSFQDEVALLVVSELNTVVTKKEKERMLTPETENIAAYNLYLQGKNFIEIYVNTSLEECERRDVKGLYKKARAGEIQNMTGISAPYEAPVNPDLEIITDHQSIETSVQTILDFIIQKLNLKA